VIPKCSATLARSTAPNAGWFRYDCLRNEVTIAHVNGHQALHSQGILNVAACTRHGTKQALACLDRVHAAVASKLHACANQVPAQFACSTCTPPPAPPPQTWSLGSL
jgi:hypothetical protein